MKRKKGYFSISVVSRMFSVHQQTIRLYEKEGLIIPKRSTGNTRLFSEEDIDKLEEIIYLTHKLKINISGVEMILKLQKKIQKLQEEMNKLFVDTQNQLEQENFDYKKQIKNQVSELQAIKKRSALKSTTVEEEKHKKEFSGDLNQEINKKQGIKNSDSNLSEEDEWEIDYNE
ncbi:TPA: hypothetical protein DEO28_01220 [Candidatus Dependentiae bacterium]|nr:MAG: Transcriptional regulator (MerR family) protein [candidate division TM6 bacterium GW2011_GWE2_31_21]KKP53742.1 MAG: Transcriptional regulator (MerR family) protein [candidate division TM6 bacterium GW2011_GWF2_33_332]HBS48504.1 hypothetical protein [Candidatus Dependentiae bacterium]HBZ73119.1 hypothetical protein [Candidatus Dependentiae bacterium]